MEKGYSTGLRVAAEGKPPEDLRFPRRTKVMPKKRKVGDGHLLRSSRFWHLLKVTAFVRKGKSPESGEVATKTIVDGARQTIEWQRATSADA